MRLRPRPRMGLALLLLALSLVVVVAARPASADERTVTAGTEAEAWYLITSSPSAAPPGAPEVNPYPPDTLHVAAGGGQERARTYLGLDLSALTFDDTIAGGTLVLPIDGANSTRPEAATLRICLGPSALSEVRGAVTEPPPVDCSGAVTPLYTATPSPAFVADLSGLATGLDEGGGGLAVVADLGEATGAWHVAFFDRENASEGAQPITAALTVLSPGDGDADEPGGDVSVGPLGGGAAAPGTRTVDVAPSFGEAALPDAFSDRAAANVRAVTPALSDQPSMAGGSAVSRQYRRTLPLLPAADAGSRYTSIWLLPLAVLVAAGVLGWAFTREPEPEPA